MKRFLIAVALVGATLFTTADAEAGIFGRRCGVVRVRTVRVCQPVRVYQPVTVYRSDACGNCRVAPVRTVIARTGQVLHRVLPPYRGGCVGNTCTIAPSTTVNVEVQSHPAPSQAVEVTPPAPNVLPAAPTEDP